jgi:hypothetical protein
MAGWRQVWQHEQEAESSQEAERTNWKQGGYIFSKIISKDAFQPSRLNLQKTVPPTGGQIFKCQRLQGTFLIQTTTCVHMRVYVGCRGIKLTWGALREWFS